MLRLFDRPGTTLQEILELENALTRLRSEIESLESQQRVWTRQTEYSSVTIALRRPALPTRKKSWTPMRGAFDGLGQILADSCAGIVKVLAFSLSVLVFLLPWLVLAGVAVLVWRAGFGRWVKNLGTKVRPAPPQNPEGS